MRTLQTEDTFRALLASTPRNEETARTQQIVDRMEELLGEGTPLEEGMESILATFSDGGRIPLSALQVVSTEEGLLTHLVQSDAPPLFLTRRGRLVLPPVLEDLSHGHHLRTCRFPLRDGDHLAMASEGYIRVRGRGQRWAWKDIATYTRRWTDTGCSAEQLLGALMRTYERLAAAADPPPPVDVSVIAMHIRPMRSLTLWTGPPADSSRDEEAWERLMAEPDTRVICGDTTAQIAARQMGADLRLEPRPPDGWAEVPPTSHLEGVDLVTEGLVTMGKARERMAEARRVDDLPRRQDGATRLARALLAADRIHFIVGLAVNPAQSADPEGEVPLRRILVDDLMQDIKDRGKIISVEYL